MEMLEEVRPHLPGARWCADLGVVRFVVFLQQAVEMDSLLWLALCVRGQEKSEGRSISGFSVLDTSGFSTRAKDQATRSPRAALRISPDASSHRRIVGVLPTYGEQVVAILSKKHRKAKGFASSSVRTHVSTR